MIESDAAQAFEALAVRLEQHAVALAGARRRDTALAAQADPSRWRGADLLWPLFAKG
jgi:hypothetical protein